MARLGRLNALHAALSGIAGGIGGYERLREKEKAEAERQRLEAERAEERALRNLQTQEWLRDRNYTEVEPRDQAMQRIAPTLGAASQLAEAEARPALRAALGATTPKGPSITAEGIGSIPAAQMTRGGVSTVGPAIEQALKQKQEIDKPYRDTVQFGGKTYGRRQLPQEVEAERRRKEQEAEIERRRTEKSREEQAQIDALQATGRYGSSAEVNAAVRGGPAYKEAPQPEWKREGYDSEQAYLKAVRAEALARNIPTPRAPGRNPMMDIFEQVARFRGTRDAMGNFPDEDAANQYLNSLLQDYSRIIGGGQAMALPPRPPSAQDIGAQRSRQTAGALGGGTMNPFGGGGAQGSGIEAQLRNAGFSAEDIAEYLGRRR